MALSEIEALAGYAATAGGSRVFALTSRAGEPAQAVVFDLDTFAAGRTLKLPGRGSHFTPAPDGGGMWYIEQGGAVHRLDDVTGTVMESIPLTFDFHQLVLPAGASLPRFGNSIQRIMRDAAPICAERPCPGNGFITAALRTSVGSAPGWWVLIRPKGRSWEGSGIHSLAHRIFALPIQPRAAILRVTARRGPNRATSLPQPMDGRLADLVE